MVFIFVRQIPDSLSQKEIMSFPIERFEEMIKLGSLDDFTAS